MKKTIKLLSVFGILLVPLFNMTVANAVIDIGPRTDETMEELGSTSHDAYMNGITGNDNYSIDINWGSFLYQYYKNPDGNYEWSAYHMEGSAVEIANNSSKAIKANLSWTPNIEDVSANFVGYTYTDGHNNCVRAANGWEGGYVTPSNPQGVRYLDNNCTEIVPEGAEYDSNHTYYSTHQIYDDNNVTSTNNTGSIVIDRMVSKFGANFEPVGSVYDNQYLTNHAWINMQLSGGNPSKIKQLYNSGNKKIGTVTLTITDAE